MVVNNPHKMRLFKLWNAYQQYCDSHTIWPSEIPKYDPNTGIIPHLSDYTPRTIPIEHSFESFKNNKELREIWIKK